MSGSACVIGLGSMGYGGAASLVRAGFSVTGVDLKPANLERLVAAGGKAAATLAEGAKGADAVLVFVVNSTQAEAVLLGPDGAVPAMQPGAVVCLCTTVAPAYAEGLERRLASAGILMLDAPVSGGPTKAERGEMTVMASGSAKAFARGGPFLVGMASKLYELGDKAGIGSRFKMINQHLAGTHIAIAAEAMAFAVKSGLDPKLVYEVICSSAGASWMFENRVPHILDDDYTPKSSIDIWTKDLGIVLETAKEEHAILPIASTAFGRFKQAAAEGLGREDDAAIFKIYARELGLASGQGD